MPQNLGRPSLIALAYTIELARVAFHTRYALALAEPRTPERL